jgi:hypothetical protein
MRSLGRKKRLKNILPLVVLIAIFLLIGVNTYSYYYQTAEADFLCSSLSFENPDLETILAGQKNHSIQIRSSLLAAFQEGVLGQEIFKSPFQKIYPEINDPVLRC